MTASRKEKVFFGATDAVALLQFAMQWISCRLRVGSHLHTRTHPRRKTAKLLAGGVEVARLTHWEPVVERPDPVHPGHYLVLPLRADAKSARYFCNLYYKVAPFGDNYGTDHPCCTGLSGQNAGLESDKGWLRCGGEVEAPLKVQVD